LLIQNTRGLNKAKGIKITTKNYYDGFRGAFKEITIFFLEKFAWRWSTLIADSILSVATMRFHNCRSFNPRQNQTTFKKSSKNGIGSSLQNNHPPQKQL
jgi:hypothetical protein